MFLFNFSAYFSPFSAYMHMHENYMINTLEVSSKYKVCLKSITPEAVYYKTEMNNK